MAGIRGRTALTALILAVAGEAAAQAPAPLPASPLHYRAFTVSFRQDGAFSLQGPGWPAFSGTWKADGDHVVLTTTGGAENCGAAGRYRVRVAKARVTLDVVSDECRPRRMILDRSVWMPAGAAPERPERRIVRSGPDPASPLAGPAPAQNVWPMFRGPGASGIAPPGQGLPERWNGSTGENVLWRTPIPGLAHSSPVVWGGRVYVTTAISSRGAATFRPGLYGDGDASDDLSPHRWMLYAIDAASGRVAWERTAVEGVPRSKRHIKSTYASASPATDGRIVVAWFGSEGVFAYDLDGTLRWRVDLGRVDMGAYDIPAFEWGPASSPIMAGPRDPAGGYAVRFLPPSARRAHRANGLEDRP